MITRTLKRIAKSKLEADKKSPDFSSSRSVDRRSKKAKNNVNKLGFFKQLCRSSGYPVIGNEDDILEAIASDLFRFILGTSRIAKARVVSGEDDKHIHVFSYNDGVTMTSAMSYEDNKHVGVFSYLNSKGFTSYRYLIGMKLGYKMNSVSGDLSSNLDQDAYNAAFKEIYKAYEKEVLNNSKEAVKQGICETKLAMHILRESDVNPSNLGINNDDEVSLFDFNHSLRGEVFKENTFTRDSMINKDIATLYQESQDALASADKKTIDRFYACQLQTLILTESVVAAVVERHPVSSKLKAMIKTISDLIFPEINKLKNLLVSDPAFKEFFTRCDIDSIIKQVEIFLRYERRNSVGFTSFQKCMNSVMQNLTKLNDQMNCGRVLNFTPYKEPTNEQKPLPDITSYEFMNKYAPKLVNSKTTAINVFAFADFFVRESTTLIPSGINIFLGHLTFFYQHLHCLLKCENY